MNSIIEAVNLVRDDILEDHERVSEVSLALQETTVFEALNEDTEAPCVVQWEMLWFSAPTRLVNDLRNDGVIFEKYSATINWAFQRAFLFSLPQWR